MSLAVCRSIEKGSVVTGIVGGVGAGLALATVLLVASTLFTIFLHSKIGLVTPNTHGFDVAVKVLKWSGVATASGIGLAVLSIVVNRLVNRSAEKINQRIIALH